MKRILFQGDSITDALRSRERDEFPGNGYPTLIKARLGADMPGKYECLNRGVSGDRVVDINSRIRRDLINLSPDYLSILIGINDVWHELGGRNGVNNTKFFKTYCDIIEEVLTMCPGVKIFILEPFVLKGPATEENWGVFDTETRMRAESAKRVAEKYGLTFVPLQAKLDALCEQAPTTYWLHDGVHPTAMGHAVIAQALEEAVEKQLA